MFCVKAIPHVLTHLNLLIPQYSCVSCRTSHLVVPDRVTVREVWAELNGTLEGTDDISVENDGELFIWSHARSFEQPAGEIHLDQLSVRSGGKVQALSADDSVNKMTFQ